MKIQLSVSASGAVPASEITNIAQALVPKLKAKIQGITSEHTLKREASTVVDNWVTRGKDFDSSVRASIRDRVIKRLIALYSKKPLKTSGPGEKPMPSGPKRVGRKSADAVVPITKAATKEEKLKAQILAGTKLRNQFAGMLTKAPALTSKSIENIRKHCDAYLKVINVVQKGKTDLAETTKIEGLRGIESVKNYVSGIRGLTYGYVELVKYLGAAQNILGEKISAGINIETMTKVAQKQRAKENAQRNLSYAVKALSKRGCALPAAFLREVEKVFVDGAQSGDYKTAKARLRELITGLVNDVFTNKVKLFQSK